MGMRERGTRGRRARLMKLQLLCCCSPWRKLFHRSFGAGERGGVGGALKMMYETENGFGKMKQPRWPWQGYTRPRKFQKSSQVEPTETKENG